MILRFANVNHGPMYSTVLWYRCFGQAKYIFDICYIYLVLFYCCIVLLLISLTCDKVLLLDILFRVKRMISKNSNTLDLNYHLSLLHTHENQSLWHVDNALKCFYRLRIPWATIATINLLKNDLKTE